MWSHDLSVLLSPLAAHAEHHNKDRNHEGRGSSNGAQQQDLAVGRSREVQPVLHGGHVGAPPAHLLAHTHTHTLSHSLTLMHAGKGPLSHWDLWAQSGAWLQKQH